jgi:hypothetical protein
MTHSTSAGAILITLGLLCAASAASADPANTSSSGYLNAPDAPLVAPLNPSAHSDTTADKQRASGYFPQAGAPLVTPTRDAANADSTLQKQQKSGYFPAADAPLVAPTTNGPQ